MYRIVRYNQALEKDWNEFAGRSRNATFLFNRGYMDYHSDRFEDCSWMAYKNNRLMAMLPANLSSDGVLHSHQGLTYGGWILPAAHLDGSDLLDIFRDARDIWKKEGIKELDYKSLPYFYCLQPSQEDEYALYRLGAKLTGCGLSSTIDLRNGVKFNQLRRRNLNKSLQLPLSIETTADVPAFMKLVADCLQTRHDVAPVHSADEMRLLISRFPENIRLHVVKLYDSIEAGVCVYDTGITAHAQYIAATPEGRRLNLLTPLFHKLITEDYASRNYFDFGISTEDGGDYLNEGLLRQKSSYGATATVYKRFSLILD